jgi:hypothetical protein
VRRQCCGALKNATENRSDQNGMIAMAMIVVVVVYVVVVVVVVVMVIVVVITMMVIGICSHGSGESP